MKASRWAPLRVTARSGPDQEWTEERRKRISKQVKDGNLNTVGPLGSKVYSPPAPEAVLPVADVPADAIVRHGGINCATQEGS